MEFAPALVESLDSVLFWGQDRTVVTAGAAALALRSNPSFLWLDVRGYDLGPDPYSRVLAPLVTDDRRYGADAEPELAPMDAPLGLSMASVVRAEEIDETVVGLVDFLRLPRAVQRLVSRRLPGTRPVVLLITSADRMAHFYLERTESTRGYVETLKSLGVKLVVSYVGPARRDRFAFDHSFRVDDGAGEDWAMAFLSTDRGGIPEGTAGFGPTRLGEIDSVREVMDRAEVTK